MKTAKIDASRVIGALIIAAAAIIILYEFVVRGPAAPRAGGVPSQVEGFKDINDIEDGRDSGGDGDSVPRYAGPACCPRPLNEAARRADSPAKVGGADTSLEKVVLPDGL